MWSHRHLLGIDGLAPADILHALTAAEAYLAMGRASAGGRKSDALRGATIINLFFEASTRTRSSFELAGKRLGADVVNVSVSESSAAKGETLLDTVRNLDAMHTDVVVLRHSASGAPHFIAKRVKASVVNAGDGAHEHPTQALLDAFTIRKAKRAGVKATDPAALFKGLAIAICGDIQHSRVARSGALCLTKLGAEVRLVGPRTVMPLRPDAFVDHGTLRVHKRLEEAVEGADVVMILRIQNERLAGATLPSTREYARTFGLNARVLALAKSDAVVMHPGPINRGVELDGRIADGPRSVILEQVEAGVAVRMAVLELCAKARAA
jgi:aspartate carbamoyltransferase catalytic subunit